MGVRHLLHDSREVKTPVNINVSEDMQDKAGINLPPRNGAITCAIAAEPPRIPAYFGRSERWKLKKMICMF